MSDRERIDEGFGHPGFVESDHPLAGPAPYPDSCPRCGHSDDDHDETGCSICGCPGPVFA